MTSRRTFLREGISAFAVTPFAGTWLHAQQAPVRRQQTLDEMGQNTTQTREVYPAPDFGPLPQTLPREAIAVSGKTSLREHAHHHGLYMGTAIQPRALEADVALAGLVAQQFNMLVSENSLKWVALRPAKDQFDFAEADRMFAFARQHGMQVRGHTLVWHNSVPKWLNDDAATLDVKALLVQHIRTVVGHYRGRVHSWDVVNEAIFPEDKRTDGLRRSFWCEHVGPDYIELAFRTAHEADPHAKLCYNDYGVEYDNAGTDERRRLILELLRSLQAKNVPLHAVGVQSHIKAAQKDSIGKGLVQYLDAVRQMGLEIYLTEMDVNEDDIAAGDVATRDAQVAATYTQFLDVALANPAVKALLIWGVSDRRTWLNDGPTHHRKQPNRPQRSLPFDPQYRPTPAFFAIRDCIDKRRGA